MFLFKQKIRQFEKKMKEFGNYFTLVNFHYTNTIYRIKTFSFPGFISSFVENQIKHFFYRFLLQTRHFINSFIC